MKKLFLFFVCIAIAGLVCAAPASANDDEAAQKEKALNEKFTQILTEIQIGYEIIADDESAGRHKKNIAQARADLIRTKKRLIVHYLTTLKVEPEKKAVEKAIQVFMKIVEDDYNLKRRKQEQGI